MNTKPILQTKLYGISSIIDEIVNLSYSNKLPNKILLSGSKGSGKSTLAYHLINYMFSLNENDYSIISNVIEKFSQDANLGGLKREKFDELKGKYTK